MDVDALAECVDRPDLTFRHMMSVMTVWDESDITRWPEDDDPEAQVDEDAADDLADVDIDSGDWTVGLDD